MDTKQELHHVRQMKIKKNFGLEIKIRLRIMDHNIGNPSGGHTAKFLKFDYHVKT